MTRSNLMMSLALSGAFVLIAASPVAAQTDRYGGQSQMSATELVQHLESQGYTNIHDIEFDDGLFEVDARDPEGRAVELKIDPTNGSILEVDYD